MKLYQEKKIQEKYIYRGICAGILTILGSIAFFIVWYKFVEVNNQTGHLLGRGNLLMALLIYIFVLGLMMHILGGYKIGVNRRTNILTAQIVAIFITDIGEVFISMAITGQYRFWKAFLWRYLVLFLVQSVILCLLTIAMIAWYRRIFPPMQVIEIVGKHHNALESKLDTRPDKYQVVKVISYEEKIDTIRKEILQYDAVLVNDLPSTAKNRILKMCFELDKRVYFTPKISDIIVKSSDDLNLFDTPLYFCRNIGMTWTQRVFKRAFDILLSVIALLLTLPILLGVAIAIKIDDGGPVFYRQKRCTIGGREFWILKFRSMVVDAEKNGFHPAGANDDRVTRVGHFIRATRIDELPQFINILIGDMSVVGPRPERIEHVRMYTEEVSEFPLRMKVKGGLTGYAQVYGKYNTTALDKLKLDLIYITNYSFLMDLQIIFETMKVIFQKESTEGFSEERITKIVNYEEEKHK